MVSKSFCDVCGAELPSYGEPRSTTGGFHFGRRSYDLCKYCGERVSCFLAELKKEYTVIGSLMKELAAMKGQKRLTDSM